MQHDVFPRLSSVCLIRGWESHRKIMASDFNRRIVISDEGISGRLWNGTYLDDFKSNIEKLKILYSDPGIIFGIRRHDNFLLSVYKQYLNEKGTKVIDYLYNINDTGIIKHHELFFEERIKLLKTMFSEVFIYSQESVRERPQAFVDALIKFLDINEKIDVQDLLRKKSNVGVNTTFQVSLLRNLNKINRIIEKTRILPGLYSRPFRILKLTPRNICQNYLRNTGRKGYTLAQDLKEHLLNYYKEDWENSQKYISY